MSLPEDVPLSIMAASTSLPVSIASMLLSSTTSTYLPSSTASSLVSSMTAIASNETSGGPSRPGAEGGECKLLGPFALFIQGALGLLALLSLVYKRWRERPQRPVKIWAFDASKQVVGSALLHVANLLMSMISSGELLAAAAAATATAKAQEYQANPCSFYLLNLAIDTTLGIPILIVLLRLFTYGFSLTSFAHPPESIQSGNYGHPPKTKWWLKQCFIYFLGLLGMKLCVFFIFQLCPWIIRVGDWALRWTEGDQRLQVFFVMLFFPVVMNAIQYYIIDSFIKDQKPSDHEPIPSDDGGGSELDDDHVGRRRSHSVDHDEDEALLTKGGVDGATESKPTPPDSTKVDEYNPATDGASSSGSGGEQDRTHVPPTAAKEAT